MLMLCSAVAFMPVANAAPAVVSQSINREDATNLYATHKYYNYTVVIANTPPSDISNISIKLTKAGGIIGFFMLAIGAQTEQVVNGDFEDNSPQFNGWTSVGCTIDTIVFYNGTQSADMNGSDSLKQQWGTSAVPSVGSIPFSEVSSWGFWAKADAGAAYHHWYVAYYVHGGVFHSLITYFPDGAFDWTYFDVKARILAYDPTVATDPTATVSGIYYKSDTTALVNTWIDLVSLKHGTVTWINQSPTTWNLNATACAWRTNATCGIASFFVEPLWNVDQGNSIAISASAVDALAANSTWSTTSNYCNVVSRLILGNFVGNQTAATNTTFIKLVGLVRYALSATSNATSGLYPANAQFTSVSIRDNLGVTMGVDMTVVSGEFDISFQTTDIAQGQRYYAYLNLVPPYADALTADGRYWAVTSATGTLDVIGIVFSLFGIVSYLSYIIAAAQTLAVYFVTTLAFFVSIIIYLAEFVLYISGAMLFWAQTLFNIMVGSPASPGILRYIVLIVTGAVGLAGTTVNWMTLIFTPTNLFFFGILVFIYWFDGLYLRGRNTGQNWVSIMIGDLQALAWIVGFTIDIASKVFGFLLDIILRFAQAIATRLGVI